MSLAGVSAALLFVACHKDPYGSQDGNYDLQAPPDYAVSLVVTPPNPTLIITPSKGVVMQSFTATLNGVAVVPTWTTDRGELGTIASNGTYATVGGQGGVGTVTATYSGLTGTALVTVQYKDVGQNGDPADPGCTFSTATVNVVGKGGYGGVGGDGPGCATNAAQQTTLNSTAKADATIQWLYPYDKTIFPRGQLAPLLQWTPGTHKFDSLRLQMASKAGTYVYDGAFAIPHSATTFQNMPIPQAVWNEMNLSSSGDQVTITVSLGEGMTLYGPLSVKWIIAAGKLSGSVYYNSYGTGVIDPGTKSQIYNSGGSGPAMDGLAFAGATLGIKPGATDPVLIAGSTSSDQSGCRVCHSVSRDGSQLVTQHGDNGYYTSSSYDLKNMNQEKVLAPANSAFPGIYFDGTKMLSSAGTGYGDATSRLYTMPGGTLVTVPTGLPSDLQAAMPSFSPDGTQVVFNFYGGTGGDQKSLATMTFTAATNMFGAIKPLLTPAGSYPAVWPSFMPNNTGVLFELQTVNTEFGNTRDGNHGHLEWVDTATKTEGVLSALNGVGYLPTNSMHANDQELNYEPTMNPVPSGGYAWVVFTSRRMYGNVATQDPMLSDPRNYDWRHNVTTKKLWVAAIDLNAKPGTDPSHPAFYLPAQELYAGNSRGFWTVDPCAADGVSCETGDECCGGYCSNVKEGDGGAYGVCGSVKPTCAALNDKCVLDTDCCPIPAIIDESTPQQPKCVNGYCSTPTPPPIL